MNITRSYLKRQDGSIVERSVFVEKKKCGEVNALYINGVSRNSLDPDFGAGIEIEIDGLESYMANFRISEFWCSPAFGSDLSKVPDETQGFIYKMKDGRFGVILPVVSETYKCVLNGGEDGKLTARLFSWYEGLFDCQCLAFMYAEGDDPYALTEKCAKEAMRLLGNRSKPRDERKYPEIMEYLGWCSWDAMQIRVNETDLIKKCEEFKEKNIPVKWAMIDDMWGDVPDFLGQTYDTPREMVELMHSSKLRSFKAAPDRFPSGLAYCVDKMNEYGITVGMWHPTTGYWKGIDPEGEIARELSDVLIKSAEGTLLTDYKQEKAYKFYSAFHSYLRSCGVKFVKVDNQSMTRRFYKNLAPVGRVAREYHDGLEASVGQNFGNVMINCMGTASEDMWNRSESPVSRCSGDFAPENAAWFRKHIAQCSYNCLVQGQFYYCDWDMWWTDDGQAVKNSILRAISGGPIYVSDKLERSRKEILMPLILEDGRILRCDRPGMPTRDCLTEDARSSGKIFKLQNTANGSGIIAAFNLDESGCVAKGTVSPSDVEGLEGDEFVVYEHFSREWRVMKKKDAFDISLNDIDDFRLYVIVPIVDGFAPIGRTDKFISPKTVKYVHGRDVVLTESGEYAVYEDGEVKLKYSDR